MRAERKPVVTGHKPKAGKLSLYPLSVEDALRGAAQTGPSPGPVKRTKKVGTPKPQRG